MIKYVAHAKKWRDKINGNTYHSVKITNVKTKEEIKIPFTYGYGEQYKSSSLNALCKRDKTSKFSLYHDFIHWIEEDNCNIKDVRVLTPEEIAIHLNV